MSLRVYVGSMLTVLTLGGSLLLAVVAGMIITILFEIYATLERIHDELIKK